MRVGDAISPTSRNLYVAGDSKILSHRLPLASSNQSVPVILVAWATEGAWAPFGGLQSNQRRPSSRQADELLDERNALTGS
jgi:hypothetical protein